MVNQPSRNHRLKANDLSWFDIKKYAAAENWTLGNWNAHLALRYMIRGLLKPGSPNKHINDFAAILMVDPAPAQMLCFDKALLAKGLSRVWDIKVTDLVSITELLDHPKMKDVRSDIETWKKKVETEPEFPDAPDTFYLSVNELQRKRDVYVSNTQVINVDLLASDEQLLADFNDWLKAKRNALKMLVPRKTITKAEMKEWHRYRTLALIDLEIFMALTKTTISNVTIGSLLFPDEYDIDLAERVRKVVRPLASKLMHSDFLSAIDEQVSRNGTKKRKSDSGF